jgi:D-beta-D-heptose 7-phosphate kinase/D-beta-D-heptose 1-phosphate adenosyltransferase
MTSLAIISGGFDPVHIGHIDIIQEAHATYGDVVIILNSDKWLSRRKGKPFMCWDDRAKILLALKGVVDVIAVDDGDSTVCNGIIAVKQKYPDRNLVFCHGCDRKPSNTPETSLCGGLGIQVVWDLGNKKTVSSSNLLASWNTEPIEYDWGEENILRDYGSIKIVEYVILPNSSTPKISDDSMLFVVDGSSIKDDGQLTNSGNENLRILEIQFHENING